MGLSQVEEAIGREERRTEEPHYDEEEPALIHGICSRRARGFEICGSGKKQIWRGLEYASL